MSCGIALIRRIRTPAMKPTLSTSSALDLDLPTAPGPLRSHSPKRIVWLTFMRETAERTRRYLERHDDRERRARSRNPDPFVWP